MFFFPPKREILFVQNKFEQEDYHNESVDLNQTEIDGAGLTIDSYWSACLPKVGFGHVNVSLAIKRIRK